MFKGATPLKKILLCCIVLLLISTHLIPTINAEGFELKVNKNLSNKYNKSENDLIFNYYFEKPEIQKITEQEKTFDNIILANTQTINVPNKPILPIKPVSILLPQNTKLKQIKITTSNNHLLGNNFNIKIGKNPIPIKSSIEEENYLTISRKESSTKQELDAYPNTLYNLLGIQNFRGFSILKLNLHPVSYNAKNVEISYYDQMTLTVELEEDNENGLLYRGFSQDKNLVAKMIDNPDILDTYKEKTIRPSEKPTVSLLSENYEYIVITCEKLKNAIGKYTLQDLVDYKTNFKNLNAKIVTVEEISSISSYWGTDNIMNDTAAQIRNFIKDAYQNYNTQYILLAGDHHLVPTRLIYVHLGNYFAGPDWENFLIPSDQYYACLDGNYNSDGDGRFGEPTDGPNGDEVDLIADVYVGRAPVADLEEISNFVEKTLAYEKNTEPYLNDILMCGEYLGFGEKADWGGNFKDEISLKIPSSYNVIKLYDKNWPNDQDWPKTELIDIINDGIHIINHAGHANYDYCLKMSNSDVSLLNNDEFFFVYSVGCNSGGFDRDDCYAEYITVKTPNAAFAAIMNTRSGWGYADTLDGPSHRFDKSFFDVVFKKDVTCLGRAHYESKEENINRIYDEFMRWCYFDLALFGDPEISLKKPTTIDHDISVKKIDAPVYTTPLEPTQITAFVKNLGSNIENNIQVDLLIDGSSQDSKTIDSLQIGEEKDIIFTFTPSLGVHKIRIEISTNSNDKNLNNNFDEQNILAGPDVELIQIQATDPPIYVGTLVSVTAQVINPSKIDLENIDLKLYANNKPVNTVTINSLASEESVEKTITFAPTESKWYKLKAEIIPVSGEIQIQITNNYATTEIYPIIGNDVLLVDDSGSKDFCSIGEALKWIDEGKIIVSPGKYLENLVIDRKIDLIGSGKDTTFIYGSSTADVIDVDQVNGIRISGFTISDGFECIYLNKAEHCQIDNNSIYHANGLWFLNCCGLYSVSSHHNVIENNLFSDHERYAILIPRSNYNIIQNNTVTLSHDWDAITLSYGASGNIIQNNIICNNEGMGILVIDSYSTTIRNNVISFNGWTADDEVDEGIRIRAGTDPETKIYHNNFIGNKQNAYDDAGATWYHEGVGNYWDDYTGIDVNGDGIGDTSYKIPAGNSKDMYPSMNPFDLYNLLNKPEKPSGENSVQIGVSYEYTTKAINLDEVQIRYGWDWEGDRKVDTWTDYYGSGEICRESHTWDERGTYNIRVLIQDRNGLCSDWSDPLSVVTQKSKIKCYIFNINNKPLIYKFLIVINKLINMF